LAHDAGGMQTFSGFVDRRHHRATVLFSRRHPRKYNTACYSREHCVSDITADQISKLTWAAEAGNLDELLCPRCGGTTASVSFTHPAADAYRVYFTCSKCSFRMSGRRVGKPPHWTS